jgi:hypothetical protein
MAPLVPGSETYVLLVIASIGVTLGVVPSYLLSRWLLRVTNTDAVIGPGLWAGLGVLQGLLIYPSALFVGFVLGLLPFWKTLGAGGNFLLGFAVATVVAGILSSLTVSIAPKRASKSHEG